MLARPPSKISLLDVLQAMEGPVSLNGCVTEPGSCPLAEQCPVRGSWGGVNARLVADLRRQKFSALAKRLKGREGRPEARGEAAVGRSRIGQGRTTAFAGEV